MLPMAVLYNKLGVFLGQQLYAGDSLRVEGSSTAGITGRKLIVPLDDIVAAYWHSEPGVQMKHDLTNPFDRYALLTTIYMM